MRSLLIIILLATGWMISLLRLFFLKKDLKELVESVKKAANSTSITQINVSSSQKIFLKLVQEINQLIDSNKQQTYLAQKKLNEIKQIVTSVSHDLRTPLTTSLGYVNLILETEGEKIAPSYGTPKALIEKQFVRLQKVRQKLIDLKTLLDYFFEFSYILENVQLKMERLDFQEILSQNLAAHYNYFEEKKMKIEVELPDYPVYIHADALAMERILMNLFKNATTHGKEECHVKLHVLEQVENIKNNFLNTIILKSKPILPQKSRAKLVISNRIEQTITGDLDQLFQRFYTENAARSDKNTGLGLAIVKELTTEMNMDISVKVEKDWIFFQLETPLEQKNYYGYKS